jgi:hypothetical protein
VKSIPDGRTIHTLLPLQPKLNDQGAKTIDVGANFAEIFGGVMMLKRLASGPSTIPESGSLALSWTAGP